MSAAAAEPVENDGDNTPVPKKGKKKLIIIVAVAVLLAAGAGGGAFMWKKKRDAAAAEAAAAAASGEEGEDAEAKPVVKRDTSKNPPAFLPLDAFVVNLADRETDRYAQIGITLELESPKHAEQIKAYMPAIRNGILLVLAHKTSQELLTRSGKEKLADEIMREAVKPLGIELEDGSEEDKNSGKTPLEESPVRHVHFSSFIIQ